MYLTLLQVQIDPTPPSRPMDVDTDMTSDRECPDSGDFPTATVGNDTRPRTQPLEAKSVPPALSKFMEQIAGQLDILTQVRALSLRPFLK